ncbi:Down syndrome cell adhesion molecule-like protein Dscam2 [Hyalella azteca]|uniref:Down syndrome cell adhesion molecule-like protein Dscam2 n=1 Tax=Hyalella azteca TaxID=294128 RepID=A0A979FFL7_HYAAZ|nr:Down syndrome cell adhesion molecule-like protein Dscam2 [Hyalella azteca]
MQLMSVYGTGSQAYQSNVGVKISQGGNSSFQSTNGQLSQIYASPSKSIRRHDKSELAPLPTISSISYVGSGANNSLSPDLKTRYPYKPVNLQFSTDHIIKARRSLRSLDGHEASWPDRSYSTDKVEPSNRNVRWTNNYSRPTHHKPPQSHLANRHQILPRSLHYNFKSPFKSPIHQSFGQNYRGLYQRSGQFARAIEAGHKVFPVQNYQSSVTSSDPATKFDSKSSPIRGTDGGLQWLAKPPRKVVFGNSTGASIQCRMRVLDALSAVTWTYQDGRPLANSGLVAEHSNGTLQFAPFPSQAYDAAVHDAVYACRLASSLGVVVSTPVAVRAVIETPYDVEAYDAHALTGNVALLTCVVPPYVQGYVTATSWVRDDVYNVVPSQFGDDKYHMTSSGDLLVFNVVQADGGPTYRCRTVNSISGVTTVSSSARIIVTDSDRPSAPRVTGTPSSSVTAAEGSSLSLPCVAQARPVPTYTWYKNNSPLVNHHNTLDRVMMRPGLLEIAPLHTSDEGEYRCVVNNTVGTAAITTYVKVTTPLVVQVSPEFVEVDAGEELELRCVVTGSPVDLLVWYKDGQLTRTGSAASGGDVLRVGAVQSPDTGVYQCLVQSSHEAAQATAVVRLGGFAKISSHTASTPRLVYRFIAHTLQPGPAVSLKCIARATPTPHITWTLDGFPLPQSHRFVMGQYVSRYQQVRDGLIRVMLSIDGEELPSSDHQSVDEGGTLQLTDVTRAADEGTYACTAWDRQGRSDTQAFTLTVTVPPRLAPIVFSKGTRSGMRAQATCLVQEGDTPITIRWLKDGLLLDPSISPDLEISQLNEFTSVLVIAIAKAHHSGNYTCSASNAGHTTQSSAILSVKVPPEWQEVPHDASVALAAALHVPCSATGNPAPTVTWKHQTESGNWKALHFAAASFGVSATSGTADLVAFRSSVSEKQPLRGGGSGNSSLVINKAERRHEGRYSCQARNGVGPGLSKVITVSVSESGNWKALHFAAASFGVSATSGTADLVAFRSSGSEKQQLRGGGSGNSSLVINKAERRHEGRYSCQARNGVGPGLSKVITVSVSEPPWFPDPPKPVEVMVGDAASLRCRVMGDAPLAVSWTSAGQPLFSSQRIQSEVKAEDAGGVALLLTVQQARSADSGTYECQASNAHGARTAEYQLLVQDVPVTPSGVRVTDATSRSLVLWWDAVTAPVTSSAAVPVMSYTVTITDNDGSVREVQAQEARIRLDHLSPATEYVLRVTAVNRVGKSIPSKALLVTTLEEKPTGYPRNIRLVSSTSRSVRLSWSPPFPNASHGSILGYQLGYTDNSFAQDGQNRPYNFTAIDLSDLTINNQGNSDGSYAAVMQYQPDSSISSLETGSNNLENKSSSPVAKIVNVQPSGVVEISLESLSPNTRYAMLVRAFNAKGLGPPSPAVTVTTDEDRPDAAPSEVSCTPTTSSTLTVAWSQPPARGANGVITGYRVAYVKVHRKEARWGELNVPGNRSFKPKPGHRFLPSMTNWDSLSFDYLANTGTFVNSPIPYGWRKPGSVGVSEGGVLVVGDGTSARLVSLSAFTNYSVVVAAATRVGVGVPSEALVCTTLQDVPSAPESIKAVAVGPHSAIVAWRPPLRTNGLVTKYTVRWRTPADAKTWPSDLVSTKVVDGEERTTTVHDLPQEAIEFWVTASTEAGQGERSNVVTVHPSNVVRAGVWSVGGRVSVAWKTPVELPCAAVGDPAPHAQWTVQGSPIQETSNMWVSRNNSVHIKSSEQQHSGLYSCTVTNTQGSDNVSYVLAVLVPPSTPTLHVTESTHSSVRLQWSTETDPAVPVLYATLSYISAGKSVSEEVRGWNHVVDGLACGTEYTFSITATNEIGTSEPSANVTTRSKGVAPKAPSAFQFVTSNSTHATLYLAQWQAGGCDITGFSVAYRRSASQGWHAVTQSMTPVRTYTVLAPEPGASYQLQVTAHSPAGDTTAHYDVHGATEASALPTLGSRYGDVEGTSWTDPRLAVPVTVSVTAVLMIIAAVIACSYRKRVHSSSNDEGSVKESTFKKSPADHAAYPAAFQDYNVHRFGPGQLDEKTPKIYHYATLHKTEPLRAAQGPTAVPSFPDKHVTYQAMSSNIDNPLLHSSFFRDMDNGTGGDPRRDPDRLMRGERRSDSFKHNDGFDRRGQVGRYDHRDHLSDPRNSVNNLPADHDIGSARGVMPSSYSGGGMPQTLKRQNFVSVAEESEQESYASLVYAAPSLNNVDGSITTDECYGELRGSSASEKDYGTANFSAGPNSGDGKLPQPSAAAPRVSQQGLRHKPHCKKPDGVKQGNKIKLKPLLGKRKQTNERSDSLGQYL